MVIANLHIICGNCGCNTMLKWLHRPELVDDGELIANEDVSIYCARNSK